MANKYIKKCSPLLIREMQIKTTGYNPRGRKRVGHNLVAKQQSSLPYSCLENLMGRGTWQATVHGSYRVGHD